MRLACLEALFKLGAVRIDSSMSCLRKLLLHRLEYTASRMHAVLVNKRRENAVGYWKPPRLLEVLEELYNQEPKLRSCEMREIMQRMRDEDGGLLFCFAKQNTTGMLLLEDQIQSWINSTTKKKKKNTHTKL